MLVWLEPRGLWLTDSTIEGVFHIAVYVTQLPNDLYCTHPLTSPYLSVAVLLNPARPYPKPSCLRLKNTAAVAQKINEFAWCSHLREHRGETVWSTPLRRSLHNVLLSMTRTIICFGTTTSNFSKSTNYVSMLMPSLSLSLCACFACVRASARARACVCNVRWYCTSPIQCH